MGALPESAGADIPALAADMPLPHELYLESTNRCNERCDQCPRTHLGREPDKDLTLAEMRHITDQLPQIDLVVLQRLGVPLINPELPQIVSHLRRRGAHAILTPHAPLLAYARARTPASIS